MGERANYVVVENGSWELYYSHWGATRVDLDLIAGPEAATRFVRAQRPADRDEGWLDDVWCEAGVLIDRDSRCLALFSWHAPESITDRRLYYRVLARTWPGWTVRWAYDGIGEIARTVGVDRDAKAEAPGVPEQLVPAEGDHVEFLITVADGAGQRGYALWADAYEIPWWGPSLLDALPDAARVDALTVLPESGLHIDTAARRVGVWTTGTMPSLRAVWPMLWPGWQLDFWADRYEEQRDRCRGAIAWPAEDLARALSALSVRVSDGWRTDPRARAAGIFARISEASPGSRPSDAFYDHAHVVPAPGEIAAVDGAIAAERMLITGH